MAIDLTRMARKRPGVPSGLSESDDAGGAIPVAPPLAARSRSLQRLQIGLTGLAAITLVIGIATIIKDRAAQTEATIVAEAGQVDEAETEPQNDALVDAGLVPDLPAEPAPSAVPDPAVTAAPGAAGAAQDPDDDAAQ